MSMDFKQYKDKLLFVPLGGSNEIGMNLNLYHYEGKWIMIDCGIGFADDYLPGVDIIMPNIDFIAEIKDSLLALILTHAHEDHLGSVGYLWEDIGCPIYATPFTAAVLKPKLKEEGLVHKIKIHEVKQNKNIALGPFELEMVALTHSIPEMHAIAIRTKAGTVMHTGDWKMDKTPMVGEVSDADTLKRYGDEGILAMVCDSTNVMVEGESGSEGHVRGHLKDVIAGCEKRVVVTTFASNIARLESIIYAGLEAGRSIALAGRSLWRITDAAKQCGYLQDIPPFLNDRDFMGLPKENVLLICTGCQGESRAALTKIARDEHPAIRLAPGDTVIFSSRVIPGNETKINWLQNKLVEQGLDIIGDKDALIHVSGHPCREELRWMYQLVRPHISVPVHGEHRHIHEHANFAREMQVPKQVEAYNGAVIQLDKNDASVVGHVPSGYLAMDGTSLIDSNSPVMSTRRKIRDDGTLVVSIVIDKKGKVASAPQIAGLGLLDPKEDQELINTLSDAVKEETETLMKAGRNKGFDDRIRSVLRKIIREELGKKPVLAVHLHELA
ncbi:MAG: RNase J family beta-CASP ribonuclease [Rickettsiales bacterium]|nr:RNase J family beta-CASP ribonuclease [Rickettsiales bacterium]|tara:strand:+ start:331 stop:1995 length:1665 start_codon:yes stop_codon:yes gene_type:complete